MDYLEQTGFEGTPGESNYTYELNTGWDRIGFARYPNRRGFFRLMADPVYGQQSAYKLMGARTNLIPMSPQWVVPDLRLMTSLVLLMAFFAIAWIRALRQFTHSHADR